MRLTIPCVLASVLLLPGCSLLPREQALPDPAHPHQLAKPATLTVWVRRADGTLVEQQIQATTDFWVAGPEALR